MNNNDNLPATSTLLQKLVLLSAQSTQDSLPSPMTPRAEALLEAYPPIVTEGVKTTVFHTTFNTEAEFSLSFPDIDLGAVSQLSPIENPSLIDMKLAYGERTAVTWLLPHVAALNASSGASNRMDAAALALCCRDILAAYPYLTLAEFCIFCGRMRSLRYVRKRSDYIFSSDTVMQGLQEFHADIVVDRTRYLREHAKPKVYGNEIFYDEWINSSEYKRLHAEQTLPADDSGSTFTLPPVSEVFSDSVSVSESPSASGAQDPDASFIRKRDEQLARLRKKYPAQ